MANYRLEKDDVKARARGRWLEIFAALAPSTNEAISKLGLGVKCPRDTGKVDGFRIPTDANDDGHVFHNQVENKYLSDGIGALMWLRDWKFIEAMEHIDNYLNGNGGSYKPPKALQKKPDDDSWKRAAGACAGILKHSQRGFNAPVTAYLQNRGIAGACSIQSPALLSNGGIAILHNGQKLKRGGSWVTVPALVGRLSTSSGWVGLNIVRVTKDGEKAGDYMRAQIGLITGTVPKKISSKQLLRSQPKMTGGAVRFGSAGECLCVGEGLETMLAVASELGTTSAAAAGHAGLLESVEIPDRVKRLLIFADKDRTGRGEQAAEILRDKVRGRMDVEIFVPPSDIPGDEKSVDWLDDKEFLKSLPISF